MRKKIAFYVESMVVGGAEKVLIDMVNHLDPEKYEISVISIFRHSVYSDYTFQFDSFFAKHIRYCWLIDNKNRLQYKMFNHAFAQGKGKKLYHKYIREKYDVEVAFYEGFPTAFLSYSDNPDSRKIAWLHTDNRRLYQGKTQSQLDKIRKIYEAYDIVAGVSDSVTDSFRAYFPDVKTTTVYNLIDEEAIMEKAEEVCIPEPNQRTRFLTVGRLIPVKGYDRFLYCIKKLHDEGYPVEAQMIGDGSCRGELEEIIKENRMESYVQLLGMQSNPYPYMKAADYLVCSSLAEGFSTVVLEALVSKLPVLTTDCSGMREIFGEYECGIISENSVEGIYSMMRKVLDEPDCHQRFVSQIILHRGVFSIQERLKAYDTLFEG